MMQLQPLLKTCCNGRTASVRMASQFHTRDDTNFGDNVQLLVHLFWGLDELYAGRIGLIFKVYPVFLDG